MVLTPSIMAEPGSPMPGFRPPDSAGNRLDSASLENQPVLAGREPDPDQTASMGCNIKWRE